MSDELRSEIEIALCDLRAPWYGSNLVLWVDDYLKGRDAEVASLKAEVEKLRTSLLDEVGKKIFAREERGKFLDDLTAEKQRVKELEGVIREMCSFWLHSPDDKQEYQKEAGRLSGLMVAALPDTERGKK